MTAISSAGTARLTSRTVSFPGRVGAGGQGDYACQPVYREAWSVRLLASSGADYEHRHIFPSLSAVAAVAAFRDGPRQLRGHAASLHGVRPVKRHGGLRQGRLCRLRRRMGLGCNPMRRGSDRLQTAVRAGQLIRPEDEVAGTTTTVWISRDGQLASPPRSPGQAASQAAFAAAAAVALLA